MKRAYIFNSDTQLTVSSPRSQEPAVSDPAANHSQGDANLLDQDEDVENELYYPPVGRCGECGAECNPNEQLCVFCRTSAHRMTGMF